MPKREMILDGLAWAGIKEKARVAKISAQLVRELNWRFPTRRHTLTRVREAVRETAPPYGRSKPIVEAVLKEYPRQFGIYAERQQKKQVWEDWLDHQSKLSTRRNRAYAQAFSRPEYEPRRSWEGHWNDPERDAWCKQEEERDKGDKCLALSRQGNTVVALVESTNGENHQHLATRTNRGEVIRTYFRDDGLYQHELSNLPEAALELGGPKVRAALAKGKKVMTDWAGRRTFIHHEGQDHVHPHVEEIPWMAATIEQVRSDEPWQDFVTVHAPVLVHGETVTPDYNPWSEDHRDYLD